MSLRYRAKLYGEKKDLKEESWYQIRGIDVREALSGSFIQKGLKLEDVFFEVEHNETLGLCRKGQLRLCHMIMHSNRFFTDDLQAVLYRNLARYVFSRAKLEDFKPSRK